MTSTAKSCHRDIVVAPQIHDMQAAGCAEACNGDNTGSVAGAMGGPTEGGPQRLPERLRVQRGLTQVVSSTHLRNAIRTRALQLANRFRVIRTIDVALACFPERDYKAALTAAQRAMRGLVKDSLLRRYRTNRFQTVYGLTQKGASYLHELDIDAAASVRRVCDMTNPEHRLWAQFVTLAAEARGLPAWTESELMQMLDRRPQAAKGSTQGMLRVEVKTPKATTSKFLRPDALLSEQDGATWVEVDRSARGSDRAADLRALVLAVGADLADGSSLRRVVVFVRTDRIRRRVLAQLSQVVQATKDSALVRGRRQARQAGGGVVEIWLTEDRKHRDGRLSLVDRLAGHVFVQQLPVWLPKLRLDGRGADSTAGWMNDNYLPYQRPPEMPAWPRPSSPMLSTSRPSIPAPRQRGAA